MQDTTTKYKFLIKDKTELNHNKHELSLISYSHLYIIMIIQTVPWTAAYKDFSVL